MRTVPNFRRQKGQTLALVAVAMVSFIAMAALAIDLTSLYSARSEIQRAADATALAGAKAFVDSGFMTDPQNMQGVATSLANAYTAAAATQNLVANAAPQVASTQIDVSSKQAKQGNPTITVKLQRTDLPLFFSRIWGNNFATVSATASAEAYNPGQSGSQSFIPSAPRCVKPILMTNLAPGGGPFVDGKGQVVPQVFGMQLNDVTSACQSGKAGCQWNGNFRAKQYLPMQDSNTPTFYPSCSFTSDNPDFEKSVAGCDGVPFDKRQCGSSNVSAQWDSTINAGVKGAGNPVTSGLQCLIHAGGGNTLDRLDPSFKGNGLLIDPGDFSQSRYGLGPTDHMLTSDSIIAVPIFEGLKPGSQQVMIVGFLTLFVDKTNQQTGKFNATILNVTGCGQSASGTPISGGGVSAIPVRLIQTP